MGACNHACARDGGGAARAGSSGGLKKRNQTIVQVANRTYWFCAMAHSSGSAHGAAAKAPAAGKKKEPKAELSEEDASKKAEIDLLVERCQDVDQGIQTQALTQLRTELASSTSSMYVVPPALAPFQHFVAILA